MTIRITDILCYVAPQNASVPSDRNWIFIVVETNEGIEGFGEATLFFPYCMSGPIRAAISLCRDFLIGQDVSQIEPLWVDLKERFFWCGGPPEMTALGAIDQALWDIAGKIARLPVFKLLGGAFRERLPIYANGWAKGTARREDLVERACTMVANGAAGLKWNPFGFMPRFEPTYHLSLADIKRVADEIAAVRQAVGPHVTLMVDAWRRLDLHSAIRFCDAVAWSDLAFIEEPLSTDDVSAFSKLASMTGARLAGGERLIHYADFKAVIDGKIFGVLQPDIPRVGGLTMARKIAVAAEMAGIALAPHNPTGSLATAAAVHLGLACRNFMILERFWPYEPDEFIERDLVYENGFVLAPTEPGMGVHLDRAALARFA
jgi:galactonate dehydratase